MCFQFQLAPLQLGGLIALNFLNLRNNKLTTVPKELGRLTALTRLHLAVNHLTSLPAELGRAVRVDRGLTALGFLA